MTRPQVLLVDDDPGIREAVRHYLELEYACEVVEAQDGLAAVALLLRERDFDLVVTDLVMPAMSGLELTGFIRSTPRLARVPIVMLTSQGLERDLRRAIAMGVTAYVVKPFDAQAFRAALAPFLKGSRRPARGDGGSY